MIIKKGKYEVDILGKKAVYTNTISEAKIKGLKLARTLNSGKYNAWYLIATILTSENGVYWTQTGWKLAIPVNGTGATYEKKVTEIKKKYGVAPFKWFKK